MVRIFSACLGFIECYPQDISLENSADLQLMAMRCHFVMAAAIVSKARTEDRVDEALQRYVEVRQHVAIFDGLFEKHFQNTLAARNARVYADLTSKLSTLFVFDFEGAICLKGWDDLGQIIRKARVCKDEKMYKAMGDCLLRSNASGKGEQFHAERTCRDAMLIRVSSCLHKHAAHHQRNFCSGAVRQPTACKVSTVHVPGRPSPGRQPCSASG